MYFSSKKRLSCLRTCVSHVSNLFDGVLKGFQYKAGSDQAPQILLEVKALMRQHVLHLRRRYNRFCQKSTTVLCTRGFESRRIQEQQCKNRICARVGLRGWS